MKKAVILGNGPSLRDFDFSRFEGIDVFGMNAAYRYWDTINWYPQYYACLDLVLGLSHKNDIRRLIENAHIYGIRSFLLRDNLITQLGEIENLDRVKSFELLQKRYKIFTVNPISTGSHSLAWAVNLGYDDILLMGVDCNYVEKVMGAKYSEGNEMEIVSEHINPNYFFEGYQREGDKYTIPNPGFDVHQASWHAVAQQLAAKPVRVLNANPVSKLSAFDFCILEEPEKGERGLGRINEVIPASELFPENNARHMANVLNRPFYADFGDALRVRMPFAYNIARWIFGGLRSLKFW